MRKSVCFLNVDAYLNGILVCWGIIIGLVDERTQDG